MTASRHFILPPGVSYRHPRGPLIALIHECRSITWSCGENGVSDELGESTVTDGNASEALVPIFFLCTWPAGARSRHKLLWMRPSIGRDAFGAAVNDAFRVVEAGGVIRRMSFVWGDYCPFTDPSPAGVYARKVVREAGGLGYPPTQWQVIKMMEWTMNGIVSVIVEPTQDAEKCYICGQFRPFTPEERAKVRTSALWPTLFCQHCHDQRSQQTIDDITKQATAVEVERVVDSLYSHWDLD